MPSQYSFFCRSRCESFGAWKLIRLAIGGFFLSASAASYAQARPTVTLQEAQTAPQIDTEQLKTPRPAHVEQDQLGRSAEVQRLQSLAQTPLRKNATPAEKRAQGEAAWQLGLLQLHGLHTPLQPTQAQLNFENAYAAGYALSAAGLVWCAIDGCGQRPDPDTARKWLAALNRLDPGRAAYMEWLLLEEIAPLDAAVPSTARRNGGNTGNRKRQALLRAVRLGDPYAHVELGMELASQEKTDEALAQFKAAGTKSDAARHNIEVLKDQNSTLKLQPSGNPGQAGGAWQTFKQARVYHRGEGVPANYTEAIRLYKRAADMGSEPAQRMLALIYSRPVAGGGIDIAWMQQLAYMDVTKNGSMPLNAPTAPVSLTRDPTPLYNYISPKWRSQN